MDTKEVDPLLKRRVEELAQQKFDAIVQPCMAEFIGTMMFVFIGCMSVQDPVDSVTKDMPNAAAVAVAHGFTIVLLAVMFGGIRFVGNLGRIQGISRGGGAKLHRFSSRTGGVV